MAEAEQERENEQLKSETEISPMSLQQLHNVLSEVTDSESGDELINADTGTGELGQEIGDTVQEVEPEVPSSSGASAPQEPHVITKLILEPEVQRLERILEEMRRCHHHIMYDLNNLVEDRESIHDEMEFRLWFQHGPNIMLPDQLKRYIRRNRCRINQNLHWFFNNLRPGTVHFFAPYDMLVTRFYSKLQLVVVTPAHGNTVDIVLRRGDGDGDKACYLHLALQGINGCYLFEMVELRDEYMVNAHPRSLMNNPCPFKPIGFVKFRISGSIFLLAQMGGQPLLITLFPSLEYAFDSNLVQ